MRIYARNTTVKRISNDIADSFIKQYHRQGLCQFGGARYNLGLFYDGMLVGEVSFSNPRTSAKIREYQHELVRMTFKTGIEVIGGASKLIKHYIADYKPRNFFTYQSTLGKTTAVYTYAGMKLRRHGRDKHVLVKNGYTFETANKEHQQKGTKYLYLNTQLVNLGPDQILKTDLGTRFNNDGHRLTNKELFIKYCDYHDELISGDDLYDYNNDRYVHYIYKITSSNPADEFYYIGRHSDYTDTSLTNADLLNDGYWGSGGSRYQSWKNNVFAAGFSLHKEILDRELTWTKLVKAEKQFIGDKYKNDPYCLNLVAGGVSAIVSDTNQFISYTVGYCNVHGKTKFRNQYCCKCLGEKALHYDACAIHGKTKFNGRQCLKCQAEKNWHIGDCSIHGETMFSGNTCAKCAVSHSYTIKMCPVHGNAKFKGDKCMECVVAKLNKTIHMDTCPIHGLTKFKGDKCFKCFMKKRNVLGICPIHGKTKFNSGECVKCRNAKQYHMGDCPIHGHTKFRKDKCCKCIAANRFHMDDCPIHGRTKFLGKTCMACSNNKAVTKKWCNKCGKVTKWTGNTCMSCINHKYHGKHNEKVIAKIVTSKNKHKNED